jgi:hypothetical protein
VGIQNLADKETGKRSYFQYGGVFIPITRTNLRVDRAMATCTDSSDYEPDANLIGPTQLPVSAVVEGTIEGVFRYSTTPATIIENLFTGLTAVPCVFGLTNQTITGSGYFDITNYTQDTPVEDTVRYTCTVRSNGLFTPNC